MIVIPAISLRGGTCARLRSDITDDGVARDLTPVDVAIKWSIVGFRQLHLADVDAALGRGKNDDIVHEILSVSDAESQVDGGAPTGDSIEQLLDDGASRIVLGARAIEQPDWLARAATDFPGQLVVAINAPSRSGAGRGRHQLLTADRLELIDSLSDLPLAAIILTPTQWEAHPTAADLSLVEDVVERSLHPVMVSGGASTLADLRALENRGVHATIVGTALYAGDLDAHVVVEEFGE